MDRKNPKIANLEHLPKPIKDGLELIRDLVVEKFQPEMIIHLRVAPPHTLVLGGVAVVQILSHTPI